MKEINDIAYQKDKTLNTVTITVYMELSKDYYDEEKYNYSLLFMEDMVSNGSEAVYTVK